MSKLVRVTHVRLQYALPLMLARLIEQSVDLRNKDEVVSCFNKECAEDELFKSIAIYCFEHYGSLANSAKNQTYYNGYVITLNLLFNEYVVSHPNIAANVMSTPDLNEAWFFAHNG
ncbi:hypothetical protein [Vibrio sp. R78045]|uniref:hypothetical protein n=1 Tax=Vibrio sp. R78045 TaxID=3093868 RepID=UPI0036F3F379